MILEGVGRRYGVRGGWVLRGVGLGLPAGTLVRCAGANGSGKSTLLRLVAGVDAPSEGRITGRPARTAYVPERFPAALPLTAGDYLTHLGRIQGLGGRTARGRAGEWLERFGAARYRDTPLGELSKGTSQKVAVAQALLAEPGLLVLDEAWTGLDTGARAELDRAVRERVAAGGRVVFVDHDPRRLAGEADAAYEVSAGGVRRLDPAPASQPAPASSPAPPALAVPLGPASPTAPASAPPASPRVRIRASGGGRVPAGAGGGAVDADGRLTLTVAAAGSDAVLRGLLDAGWHIEHLSTEPEPSTEGVRA
ncbi:ATP-binding cassette domain-containing protein [Streptomyces sp. NPDC053493]|uniref:ABC transporter ATP-binding protein n=1 Tax=Streptomyces sp. NPDC053493 TaxID=3365705 RepID=UPI0037D4B974